MSDGTSAEIFGELLEYADARKDADLVRAIVKAFSGCDFNQRDVYQGEGPDGFNVYSGKILDKYIDHEED